jgi:Bacterial CdiA-CT RNAse A domain
MHMVEDGIKARPWQVLENTRAHELPEELATAKRLNVYPMHVDDPGFENVAKAGPIHWAVTQCGELLVVPQSVGTENIAQTVLTHGRPVVAAGEAEFAVDDHGPVGMRISNQSRHYLPGKHGLEIGKHAFQAFGITFLLEDDTRGKVDGDGASGSQDGHGKNKSDGRNRQDVGGGDKGGNGNGNGNGSEVCHGSDSERDTENEENLDDAQALLKTSTVQQSEGMTTLSDNRHHTYTGHTFRDHVAIDRSVLIDRTSKSSSQHGTKAATSFSNPEAAQNGVNMVIAKSTKLQNFIKAAVPNTNMQDTQCGNTSDNFGYGYKRNRLPGKVGGYGPPTPYNSLHYVTVWVGIDASRKPFIIDAYPTHPDFKS